MTWDYDIIIMDDGTEIDIDDDIDDIPCKKESRICNIMVNTDC